MKYSLFLSAALSYVKILDFAIIQRCFCEYKLYTHQNAPLINKLCMLCVIVDNTCMFVDIYTHFHMHEYMHAYTYSLQLDVVC